MEERCALQLDIFGGVRQGQHCLSAYPTATVEKHQVGLLKKYSQN